jgi:hypothetical protein
MEMTLTRPTIDSQSSGSSQLSPDITEHAKPADVLREVRFRHSRHFAPILRQLRSSLLVSTYAAGKVVAVGTAGDQLNLSFHNFEQAMGIAARPGCLAVGAQGQIWFLKNGAELASCIEPAGQYDSCYMARSSLITGNIHVHEMAWEEKGEVGRMKDEKIHPTPSESSFSLHPSSFSDLWVVNTLFSSLCTLSDDFSFVPRWRPPFITELQGQDRCHLNGLAMEHGRPRYVTMMAESDEPAGWRPTKTTSGCLMDIPSGEVVSRGLAMPHSPRVYQGRVYVLNSGLGALETVDPDTGQRDTVATMPGYTRGLAFCGPFAFVGLSKIRETAIFGGVPIAENRAELKCGVCVVDLRSGQSVAYLELETGVEEIFAIDILPGVRCVSLTGPFPQQDGGNDVWVVPNSNQVDA